MTIQNQSKEHPYPGEWNHIADFLEDTLGREQSQDFHQWCKQSVEAQRFNEWSTDPALVLVGPPGSGKGLIQTIVSELLGGVTSANSFLDNRYTDHFPVREILTAAMRSPHIVIEDIPWMEMAEAARIIDLPYHPFHPATENRRRGLTTPFIRVSISLEDESLPTLIEASNPERLLILRTRTPGYYVGEEFADFLESEILPFTYFLMRELELKTI